MSLETCFILVGGNDFDIGVAIAVAVACLDLAFLSLLNNSPFYYEFKRFEPLRGKLSKLNVAWKDAQIKRGLLLKLWISKLLPY